MVKPSTLTLPDGKIIKIGPEPGYTTIGRGFNIPATETYVSREHVEINFASDGITKIRDLDSSNGTCISRKGLEKEIPIEKNFEQIFDGDRIYLGGSNLQNRYEMIYNTQVDLESAKKKEEKQRTRDTDVLNQDDII